MLSTRLSTKARLPLPTERPLGKGQVKVWQNLGKAAARGPGVKTVEIEGIRELRRLSGFRRSRGLGHQANRGTDRNCHGGFGS